MLYIFLVKEYPSRHVANKAPIYRVLERVYSRTLVISRGELRTKIRANKSLLRWCLCQDRVGSFYFFAPSRKGHSSSALYPSSFLALDLTALDSPLLSPSPSTCHNKTRHGAEYMRPNNSRECSRSKNKADQSRWRSSLCDFPRAVKYWQTTGILVLAISRWHDLLDR